MARAKAALREVHTCTRGAPRAPSSWLRGPATPSAGWEKLLCSESRPLSVPLTATVSWALGSQYLIPFPNPGSCWLQRNIVGISNVYKHSWALEGEKASSVFAESFGKRSFVSWKPVGSFLCLRAERRGL